MVMGADIDGHAQELDYIDEMTSPNNSKPNMMFASSGAKLTIEQKKLSFDTIQEKIYIDSLKIEDVEIKKSNKLARLFDVKFLGSKICIEYSDEIDEIILVKALSVFYLKNSKTISKTNLLKQLNRILEQLLNERN